MRKLKKESKRLPYWRKRQISVIILNMFKELKEPIYLKDKGKYKSYVSLFRK